MDTTWTGLGRNPEPGACAISAEAKTSSNEATPIKDLNTLWLRLEVVGSAGVSGGWRCTFSQCTPYSGGIIADEKARCIYFGR